MFLIQYVLVIALCAQQSLGSSKGDRSSLSKRMTESRKGKSVMVKQTGTEEHFSKASKSFSFEEFSKYVKDNHAQGIKIDQMLEAWLTLGHKSVSPITQNDRLIMKEWMAGKVKYSKEDMKHQTNEKIKILKKAIGKIQLEESEKSFARIWRYDNLMKIRGTEQSNFLNGKPDQETVRLIESLEENHFHAAKDFLDSHDLNVEKICGAIVNTFFKPDVLFTPQFYNARFGAKYYCQTENGYTGKLLNTLGWCRDEKNENLFYIRIAVAKVEELKGSFLVRYVVAFDDFNYKNDDPSPGSVPQVATSFSATYAKQKDNSYKFELDISSLKGGKAKGKF